ncbi:caspase family protein [Spirosoma endbachense]|uniref:Caspase family protein n=1 Tax=Spirosoma endbachense TaxID=2666025 RepID=A0A6P1VRN6_9BACT|nr:caspase family protein [Spirosoma endbachense]QHV94026.1 caspase family protein [Spirosoma endbachense]
MLANLLTYLGALIALLNAEPQKQTYAVVVGISDYKALTRLTGDLRFADRDAQQVVTFLQTRSGGAVPASHIRFLTNRQATHANIRQALSLFREAKAGDRVIFYFSGHGLPSSFVPYDVQLDNQQNLLTYQDIKAAFHDSKASTKLCIADACLSGGMTYQKASQRSLVQTIASTVSDDNNVAMLLASRSTQSAVEAGQLAGGAFTHYLLKGLSGQADLNSDKVVTIRELHRYVAPRVRRVTQGQQTPIFYGHFSDELGLAYL